MDDFGNGARKVTAVLPANENAAVHVLCSSKLSVCRLAVVVTGTAVIGMIYDEF
jgi:hypothetical protein